MKRKIAVAITAIIVIVVIVTSLFLFLNQRQSVGVPYDGTLKHIHNFDGANLSLYFHSEKTLFNCKVTISYTAINGTAVQIVKELGIVDVNAENQNFGFSLSDYPIPASDASSTVLFNQTAPLTTLTVKAVGYTTP